MEVTTVSSSPASPTEGDDLCEIDASNMAIHSGTLLICLCGLFGNGAVLWLLGSCCLCRNTTTHYILILTIFYFLLHLVPSSLLFLVEDVSCSVIMPLQYVWLVFQLSLMYSSLGLYLLAAIYILRCRSIHCPLWHCCHHPQHLSKVVCALLWAFSIIVFTLFATSLCESQLPEHCRVSLISTYTFSLFLCAPFISSTILYVKVKSGLHQQQTKNLDIVICLIVLPLSLWKFLQEFGYTIFLFQEAFLLTYIHSRFKPFIYLSAGSCWKHCSVESLWLSLQGIFEKPEENPAGINDPAMEAVL